MIDELLKEKSWSQNSSRIFINRLYNCSDEERCHYIYKVTGELLERGDLLSVRFAEEILAYAKKHFLETADNNCKALVYYRLGYFYENHTENFLKAYEYYEKYTLLNDKFEGNHIIMLKALILKDNFEYSDELEKNLKMSLGEYDLSTKNDRLYEALGSLIVARHYDKNDKEKELIDKLKGIVNYDRLFLLDIIFKKDSYPDTLKVPQKVIDYINNL